MSERLLVLDTETTGIDPSEGHRILEIACVEIVARRLTGEIFHTRVNPHRLIDEDARAVHGISNADVANEPSFSDIAAAFVEYVRGSTLVIHNAKFDLSFLNIELARAGHPLKLQTLCNVIDTLAMARQRHPGQNNSLDALCKRYAVDASSRSEAHGALIDATLLADVYLAMTSGQSRMNFPAARSSSGISSLLSSLESSTHNPLPVIKASPAEVEAHETRMRHVHKVHLKTLEKQAADLRSAIKALTDRVSSFEERIKSQTADAASPTDKEVGSFRKNKDELLEKKISLTESEEILAKTISDGPRLF